MGTVTKLPLVARLADGYANLVSRLGLGNDRSRAGTYLVIPLSQPELESAYRSSWLTRKVHDLVPFEMTRARRAWQATKEQIEALEQAETALGVWKKLFTALAAARLYGGAAIIMGVRQGLPEQELRPEAVTKDTLRYLFVATRHQLTAQDGFEWDVESDYFGQPKFWTLNNQGANAPRIHPSRVITFHGAPLPPGASSVSEIDAFWGDPLLISIKSAIDNAEASQASVATLLHEMKQDIIKIPGLTELIADKETEEKIGARINAISQFKSMFSALLLDAGDGTEGSGESWEQRQISFSEYPELLDQFIGIVAAAAGIPKTRLMGSSPGGLQSTGKGEQDDLNRMIDALRETHLGHPLSRLDEVLIRSTLGSRPPEIYYEFGALAEADPKEAAEIEKSEAETVQIYANTALIPSDALAKAAANRLIESGRFPGLDKAIEESDRELGEEPEPDLPEAANENDVQEMQRRGAITRDQAMTLLTDASPRSLYVRRDLKNGAEFARWAREQGFTDLVDDPHVTIIYSRSPVDWMKIGSAWNGDDGELTIAPGGARLVEQFDGGAVVLLFSSWELSYRHGAMREAGADHGYDEYQPHVTISYTLPDGVDLATVEPYRGKLVFGPEIFEEIKPDA